MNPLTQKYEIRIADLGFASFVGSTIKDDTPEKLAATRNIGTPYYMAPEMRKEEESDMSRVDLWSIGVMFYTIVVGVVPFKGQDQVKLAESIAIGDYTIPYIQRNGE